MNAPSKRFAVKSAAALLVLFLAGCVVARALALPMPASVVGLGLALLGLRLGAMFAALQAPGAPAGTMVASAAARGTRDARSGGLAAATRASAPRPSTQSAA